MNEQIPPGDEKIVAEAQQDYAAYLKGFEQRFGYGIAAASEPRLEQDGTLKVFTIMKLIKLPPITTVAPPPENVTTTPSNGENETKETGASPSGEQSEG